MHANGAHATPTAPQTTEVELFSLAGHDGYLHEVNEAFARLLGLTTPEIDGRSLLELIHPDDIPAVVAGLSALEAGATETLFECRFVQDDEHTVYLQWVARPMPGTDLWWAAGRDTTDFHRLLSERLDLRARLDLAVGQTTAAMWELDVARGALTWEAQAAEILGVSPDALPQTAPQLAETVVSADAAALIAAFDELLGAGAMEITARVGRDAGLRHLSLRGKVLDRDRRGHPTRAVGLVLDITTEKAMEEQMLRMVMSDPLTGAPNRRAFDQSLRSEWRRCTRAGEPISIVMVDIDNFKAFNDTFGHLIGDEVLCAVSRSLTSALYRDADALARFGGEEFAVVLPGTDSSGAIAVGERLVAAVRETTVRQAAGWKLSVSIGTASWRPGNVVDKAPVLLARADEALYLAKTEGKDRAIAYEQRLAGDATLEAAIARGLVAGEFELYYQPIICLEDRAVLGLEALMRWNRPGYGLVSPDGFIPVAESSTLICDIGRWGLAEAAGQLMTWIGEGFVADDEFRMAVNVSGRHVASKAIVVDVEAAIAATGIDPRRLELELTETTLVDGLLAAKHLSALRELGVSIAIDDFGTGHTSIAQLPQLQADCVKIDRSFLVSDDPRQRALLPLIVEAAHAFDLRVVSEGVEDTEILAMLRDLGCDAAQGYVLARPMPASQVVEWLTTWQQGTDDERDLIEL